MPDDELQSIAKKTKWSDANANGLTKMIVEYITYIGGFASRTQSQGQYRKDSFSGKGIYTKGTTKKGLADITAVLNGYALSIEVKIGKDRQSDKQKKVEQQVLSAGGLYFIAKDFASTYEWLISDIIGKNKTNNEQ